MPETPHDADAAGARASAAHPRRNRRRASWAGLGICALICVALLLVVQLRAAGDSSVAAAQASRFSPPPAPSVTPETAATNLVAVVGDEWASPRNTVNNRPWPYLLQRDLGVQVRTFASVGGAYVGGAVGSGGATFAANAASIPSNSSVVVFFGGARDSADSTVELASAATQALAAAKQKAPRATLVLVGPVPERPGQDANLKAVRSVLQVVARTARADWIDPVEEKWFNSDRYWAGTGAFPSPAGNERLEARMAESLAPLLRSATTSPSAASG